MKTHVWSLMGEYSSVSSDHTKHHQVENSHSSCDTILNFIRTSNDAATSTFQIQTGTRYSNLSINFYLVLQKMWYFFLNQIKTASKTFSIPKSMNFISPQKFLLRTVSTPVVYIKLSVM